MKPWIFCLILPLLSAFLWSQEVPEIDDEQAAEEYNEDIVYLLEHPVNLNHASLIQLMSLPQITPYQALRMNEYLKSNPGLNDPYRLATDSILDQAALSAILPYICVDSDLFPKSDRGGISFRVQRRWPDVEGIVDSTYHGSPLESRSRIWYSPADGMEIFAQTQHDVGEPVWCDYCSGSLSWTSRDKEKQIILGDYQASTGQGLVLGGNSPKIFTSYWSSLLKSVAVSVKPYHSSQEIRGLRGAAIKWPLPVKMNLLGFISSRFRDSKTDSLDDIINFYDDGYHRTDSELSRKNNARETILGGRLGISEKDIYDAGITGCKISFDKTISDGLYHANLFSLDASGKIDNNRAAIELTEEKGRIIAYNGILGFNYQNFAGMADIYGYSPEFRPPRFNAQNYYGGDDEKGVLVASWFEAPFGWDISAVYNQFYPWTPLPLSTQDYRGYRYETRLSKKTFNQLQLEFRLKGLQKELFEDSLEQSAIYGTSNISVRMGLKWWLGTKYSTDCKYETAVFRNHFDDYRDRGELLSLALKAQLPKGFAINGQSVFYHTQSYYSRLYLSEPELRSGGSFHGYWGLGRRDALLVKYDIDKICRLYLKLARQIRDYQGEVTKNTELGIEMEIMLK